jgi:hypothetical protein
VGDDDTHLALELLVGSDVYQRVRRELHSIAVSNQVPSLEEFFSEDNDYLRGQGLADDDEEIEYSFSPDSVLECLTILQAHCEAHLGKIHMNKTAVFLQDLYDHVKKVGAVGNRFRLILEPGGIV